MRRTARAPALAITLALAAVGLALPASANVIYKSVDRNGQITFSDVPPPGAIAVLRIPLSDSAKSAVAAPPVPTDQALAEHLDESVRRANAKVDLAERALALARRSVDSGWNPLALENPGKTRADVERIEFFKRDVLVARRGLLSALQSRNASRATVVATGTG